MNGCELITVKHRYENNFNTVEDRSYNTYAVSLYPDIPGITYIVSNSFTALRTY